MSGRTGAVLACAVTCALPAVAYAETRWRGETEQGRRVALRVDDAGLPDRLTIGWKTQRCEKGKYLQDRTLFNGFSPSTANAFERRAQYEGRDGEVRIRFTVRVTGKRVFVDGRPRWKGTFKARGVMRRDGDVIDRCRLREITWRAKKVAS